MFVRIVRPQIAAGKAQEAANKWKEFIRARSGLTPFPRQGYMVANADRTAVLAITVWDELPDQETTNQIQGAIAVHLGDLMTSPPTTEDYEVLAQI